MALSWRRAVLEDADLLWRWANDAETRRWSFTPAPIPYADHVAWLRARLGSEATRLWIFSDERGPVGQIRLDVAEGVAEVSLTVAPERRGQGLGGSMLRQALACARAESPGLRMRAQVFVENAASLRLFERCGFREIDRRRTLRAEVVVFEQTAEAR